VTLIDRYVAEVARRLPRGRRADIAQELRSTLLDARESRFGPTASDQDEAVLLRELGPPGRVAASYGSPEQHLIGPEWFPAFALALRIHLLSLVGVLVVGSALIVASAAPGEVAPGLARLLGGLVHYGLLAFGAVVLVFHLLERGAVRAPGAGGEWDPHTLPALPEGERVGRGEALTAVVGAAIGLILLHQFGNVDERSLGLTAPDLPTATAAGLRVVVRLWNAIVGDNLWWLSASAVLTMALYWVLLGQGRWRWYTRAAKLAVDLFGVYVAARIAQSVIAEQPALLQSGLPAEVVAIVLRVAAAAPYAVAALVVLETGVRLARAWREREASSLGRVQAAPRR
jgi:hypothetical protein